MMPWAGMEEPGWAGGEADGWAGLDGPDFPTEPGVSATGTPTDRPTNDRLTDALKFKGDAYQELDLAKILISHGAKEYDEETGVSVARFLTANVADLMNDFDSKLAEKIVLQVTEQTAQRGAGPPVEWFLKHPDEDVRQLAIDATAKKYSMSPNWGRSV